MKKAFILMLVMSTMILLPSVEAFAAEPYYNYNYDYNQTNQKEPQAYIPYDVIEDSKLDIGKFKSPQDLFVDQEDNVYIADTGNNRIIVLDKNFSVLKTISTFQNGVELDKLNNPSGVYVTQNEIYIADTNNKRIVVIDKTGELLKIFNKPQSPVMASNYEYKPLKICVDKYKRMYVVADNESNGIIGLDQNGEFLGFFGAVQTKNDPIKSFQRMFLTKEQKKRISLTIPTIYAGIDIDESSFVYGTVGVIDPDEFTPSMFIHKLNPKGVDILNRFAINPPMGDIPSKMMLTKNKDNENIYSFLCDVAVRDSGIYSVLDNRKGRVFTYDNEGNLLYVFGGIGNRKGQLGHPTAIDTIGDNYIILDSKYNQLVLYKPTAYGSVITQAIRKYFNNEYDSVNDCWNEALKYTSKSELVFKGKGQSLLLTQEYEKAMMYLKLANDRDTYSTAFVSYRGNLMAKYFGVAMVVLISIIVIILLYCGYKKMKRGKQGE